MTDPTARTPYCTKIRYGVSGAPEIPVDVYNAPDITLAPTLVEIRYLAPRGEQPAFVDASVSGYWMRGGERVQPEKEILHHFKNGPDGWPVWLAAEARLHAPAVVSAAAPSVDRAALRDRIAEALYEACMTEVDAVGPLADAVLSVLPAPAEPPLSPYYEHPACGFHWHGSDGMDIPVRDGQPVCPRCELAKAEKKLAALQRRRDEIGAECKRRGKRVLEQSEQILALERQVDEVHRQLGAEILRAGLAEVELRRLAAEAPATTQAECIASISGNCLRESQSETACDTDDGECVYGGRPAVVEPAEAADTETPNPRTVCVCGHTRGEHLTVSGRLLCDTCDPDSTDNLVCRGFDAL